MLPRPAMALTVLVAGGWATPPAGAPLGGDTDRARVVAPARLPVAWARYRFALGQRRLPLLTRARRVTRGHRDRRR